MLLRTACWQNDDFPEPGAPTNRIMFSEGTSCNWAKDNKDPHNLYISINILVMVKRQNICYLNSHSQYWSPIAMHFVSLTWWFLTAEKKHLRKPVVKKLEDSFTSDVGHNLLQKLSQFSLILIVSFIKTFPTLQYFKRLRTRFTTSSSAILASICARGKRGRN